MPWPDPTQPLSGGRDGGPAPGGGRWDEQRTPLHTLLILWRRRRGLILSVAALGTALATVAGLQVEPRFTATTAVMIAPRQSNVLGIDGVPAGLSADATTLETQIKLINSRDHAARVVHALSLDHDPELNPRNGHGDLAFTVADPWRIFVSWLPGDWLVATGLAEERTVQLTETSAPSLHGLLDHFARRLQVDRDARSPVISISFTSSDPVKAATIANQVAELYVEGQLAAKRSAATRASEWLRDRLEVLRDELERSEQAVARQRAQHDLPDDGISLSDRELVALQRELILAQAELAERQARRELIAAAGTEGDSLKSIPEVMASPNFADLWRQESELQRIQGELGTIFGEAHPRMRSLAADKANLAAEIETAIARIVGNIARETRVIEGRIGALKKQLDLVKGAGAESRAAVERLRELEREADAGRQTYQTVLQRYRETREHEQIVEADAQIVARAAPPLEPSSAGARLFMVFGFTGSSLMGVLLALLLERSRRGIRSAGQLETYFGLPCLAVCPRLPRAVARQGTPAHEDLLERALCAESMRALQLALRQAHHDRLPQVVQVTSVADEDKTTLAFSLAASLAQNGKRVLLFELDLRRPKLAERLQANSDMCANRPAPLFSDVRHDQCTGVDLILVNRTPANPQAILTSAGLAGVVRRLRRRYDHVVVDSAPLLGLSDTKFVSSLVDATILVIRWQSTPLDVVRDAVGALRTVPLPLLGAVITQVAIHR
jgi:polysaccharide biosynthesis transport protein